LLDPEVGGGRISAPTPKVVFADLANLPEEPHDADGRRGLIHVADAVIDGNCGFVELQRFHNVAPRHL
jgi:hypothetical protein